MLSSWHQVSCCILYQLYFPRHLSKEHCESLMQWQWRQGSLHLDPHGPERAATGPQQKLSKLLLITVSTCPFNSSHKCSRGPPIHRFIPMGQCHFSKRDNTDIDRPLQWTNSNLIMLEFKQGSLFLCIQTLDNYRTPGQDFHPTCVSSCNGKLNIAIILMDLLLPQKVESVILRGKKPLHDAYVLENYMYIHICLPI